MLANHTTRLSFVDSGAFWQAVGVSASAPAVTRCNRCFADCNASCASLTSSRARSSDNARFWLERALPSGVLAPVDFSQGRHERISSA